MPVMLLRLGQSNLHYVLKVNQTFTMYWRSTKSSLYTECRPNLHLELCTDGRPNLHFVLRVDQTFPMYWRSTKPLLCIEGQPNLHFIPRVDQTFTLELCTEGQPNLHYVLKVNQTFTMYWRLTKPSLYSKGRLNLHFGTMYWGSTKPSPCTEGQPNLHYVLRVSQAFTTYWGSTRPSLWNYVLFSNFKSKVNKYILCANQ